MTSLLLRCRHYFALTTNPGEQFYAFTSIAAWLLQMSGKHFEQPQEYDDPNATISSILDELRSFVSVVLVSSAHFCHFLMNASHEVADRGQLLWSQRNLTLIHVTTIFCAESHSRLPSVQIEDWMWGAVCVGSQPSG